MSNQHAVELLSRQRDRCLASILSVKDECDQHLPKALSVRLRKTVLDEVNALAAFSLRVLGALESEQASLNEIWLDHIQDILNGSR